jgi:hypothetical protein
VCAEGVLSDDVVRQEGVLWSDRKECFGLTGRCALV